MLLNRMVEESQVRLDAVFGALADPTRRAMLDRLSQGSATVSELAAPHAMTLAGASKHLKVLERAGLIRREVRGRTHVCSLDPEPMGDASEWLRLYRRLWSGRLGAMETMLQREAAAEAARER